MHPMGFSTGALARGDYELALSMMSGVDVEVVELSALRITELDSLVQFGVCASLPKYRFVSVHAPASFADHEEQFVVKRLCALADRGWPIVLHPDAIHKPSRWRSLGALLYIENMDKRKRIGRTAEELSMVFSDLPEAFLCFDFAHARQFDSSMNEAYKILHKFGNRIRQVHLSEVSSSSRHERLSRIAIHAYRQLASMIPSWVPVVLETPVGATELEAELKSARLAMDAGPTAESTVSPAVGHS